MSVPVATAAAKRSPLIHVFVRHCHLSKNSIGKPRPDWFGREYCLQNLLSTADTSTVVTVLFDGEVGNHFVSRYPDLRVIPIKGGSDGHSFLACLDHIMTVEKIADEDIVYFTEDDYLHRPGWGTVLREALCDLKASYASNYDHENKYDQRLYKSDTQLLVTKTCHWRTVPSTTNTYASLFKTLQSSIATHRKFCDLERGFCHDNAKFIELWSQGATLVTSVPAFATHCETGQLSPCIDWPDVQYQTVRKSFNRQAVRLML
jgi:hypothetical protein